MNDTKKRRLSYGDLAILELRQAVSRANEYPEKTYPKDDPLDVEFWLNRCINVHHLGNDPYVLEMYQKYHGRPVPEDST